MRSRLQFLDRLYSSQPRVNITRGYESYVQFPSPRRFPLLSVALLLLHGVFRRSLFRLTPDLVSVTHETVLRLSVVVRVSTPASGTPAEIQVEHEASRVCEQVQSRTPELSPTT